MKARLTLTLALLLICSGAALALDPPPTEDACANETGAAYGLCNAYCEAMDCDGEPEASATACTKVQDKYTQITGHGLPCEEVADCPCSAIFDWTAVLAGATLDCDDSEEVTHLTTTTGRAIADGDSCSAAWDGSEAIISRDVTPAQAAACQEELRSHCGPVG